MKSGGGYCQLCQKKKTIQNGCAIKSPPNDKLKKKSFRERWFVLSLVERCNNCTKDDNKNDENDKECMMLFYYTDKSESTLKGYFNLQDAIMESVDHITEDAPSKYRDCPHIIRWELPKHEGRVLYTLFDKQADKESWLKAIDGLKFTQKRRSTNEETNMENIQPSLSKLTLRYARGPSFDDTDEVQEDKNGNNINRNSCSGGCGSFTNEVFSHFREITNSFVEVALTDHDKLIENFQG